MATTVAYNTMFSQSWQNVYDLINNKSNVADPTTPVSQFRKWVYSREPDIKSVDFAGFPYIIVNSTMLDEDDEQTVDGSKKWVAWVCEVEIVTSDRAWNNIDGKGQTHLDTISDDLLEVFNSKTHRDTLSGNGLKFSKPTTSGMVTESLQDTLIYRRSLILNFKAFKKIRV